MAAPIGDRCLLRFLSCIIIVCAFYQSLGAENEVEDEYLLCRQCGHDITKAEDLLRIPSALSIGIRNATILGQRGILIQRFENPQKRRFEVITAQNADVETTGEAYAEYSWFPGYSWTICLCPHCGFHLGWYFQSTSTTSDCGSETKGVIESFFGLILDHLLHKDYADSLLVIPKSYNS